MTGDTMLRVENLVVDGALPTQPEDSPSFRFNEFRLHIEMIGFVLQCACMISFQM